MSKKYFLILLLFFSSVKVFSQNEPWKRPLKICRSIDGTNFSNIQTFQDSAGVPNVIKLPSGNLASVFQWFRQPVGSSTWDRVAVKFSSDNGFSWTEPVPIIVNNLPLNFTRPFDPTLAVTNDGRIRIFFSSGLSMVLDTSINTYSAISDDGINYNMEPGIRFSMPDRPVLDPAVIKFRNLWHLVNPFSNTSNGGAFHNISSDGLNFTRVQDIQSDNSHSWIGNYMINEDATELRFYGSGMNVWYSASPNGGEWSSFFNTNIQGGDPSVLKISPGNYLMIYTGQPYPTGIIENSFNPERYKLSQNFPNPFYQETNINFEISGSDDDNAGINNFISLKVYDISGKEITTIVSESKPAGSYSYNFNGSDLPCGIYLYKLTTGSYSDTKRMLLLK